jgi:beta-glucosidase
MTWPKRLEDVPAYATGSYPQKTESGQGDIFVDLTRNRNRRSDQQLVADYAEQSLVGYRWYDRKDVAPAYPFGFGLSYATFQYSDLRVESTTDGLDVTFSLTNTSARSAEEVAQVYIARPMSSIETPVKELKGFRRVALKAGERSTVTIPVRRADLSSWDETTQTWIFEPGDVTVLVGGSSDNLPLKNEKQIR